MELQNQENFVVAICDDSITNVMLLSQLIENEGIKHIHSFTDPRKLLTFLKEQQGKLDLLLLDIEMPHLSGFEVMTEIAKDHPQQRPYAILVITGLQDREVRLRALDAGANDFLDKPFNPPEVSLRARNLLRVQQALKLQTNLAEHLEKEVQKRTRELDQTVDLLIHVLALAGDMRDSDTGQHATRVGRYSRILAEAIGLPPRLCHMIEMVAPLHDVGKIGIPDQILHKNGKLSDEERTTMKEHAQKGLKLLGDNEHGSPLLQIAASIALNHHECWDGSGYPHQLKGESIPIEGRIVSIADVFDALTTRRPYKEPWSTDQATAYLKENAGKQFDPSVVAAFLDRREQIEQVMRELADPA